MHITLLTVGTRGDVQPYLALAQQLQHRGHMVRLAAQSRFSDLAAAHAVPFHPMGGDPLAALQGEAGQLWLEGGQNPLRFVRRMVDMATPMAQSILEGFRHASEDADLILYPVIASPVATSLGEALGIPVLPAYLQPVHHSRAYPFVLAGSLPVPARNLAGAYHLLSHKVAEQIFWRFCRPIINRWRQETLALPPYPWVSPFDRLLRERRLCLYGFSRHVFPRPPDWPAQARMTGYWTLEQPGEYNPPPALAAFLEQGPPPVYVGFGSMTGRDPAGLTTTVLAALARTGRRAVIQGGWGNLDPAQLPAHCLAVDDVPHDWLFPRVSAVVHHGGMGTCAAGLRAGVPGVIVPFFADQPFWGSRLARLGVAPPPIPRSRLTVQGLAAALERVHRDAAMRARAAAAGQALRTEQGAVTAAGLVEQAFARAGR